MPRPRRFRLQGTQTESGQVWTVTRAPDDPDIQDLVEIDAIEIPPDGLNARQTDPNYTDLFLVVVSCTHCGADSIPLNESRVREWKERHSRQCIKASRHR